MAVRIAFAMAISGICRNQFTQRVHYIALHRRVSIFVNGQAGSGVGAKQKANSLFYSTFTQYLLNLIRNIY